MFKKHDKKVKFSRLVIVVKKYTLEILRIFFNNLLKNYF